jgi:lipoprotein-releasing system permease protein
MKAWIPFEGVTAIRFLREGRLQTLAIVSGVAIGVGVIVFMSAMLTSLQGNFITRVLMSSPHIQILPPEETARVLRPDASGVTYARVIQKPAQRFVVAATSWWWRQPCRRRRWRCAGMRAGRSH